jgi:hypothetical protein
MLTALRLAIILFVATASLSASAQNRPYASYGLGIVDGQTAITDTTYYFYDDRNELVTRSTYWYGMKFNEFDFEERSHRSVGEPVFYNPFLAPQHIEAFEKVNGEYKLRNRTVTIKTDTGDVKQFEVAPFAGGPLAVSYQEVNIYEGDWMLGREVWDTVDGQLIKVSERMYQYEIDDELRISSVTVTEWFHGDLQPDSIMFQKYFYDDNDNIVAVEHEDLYSPQGVLRFENIEWTKAKDHRGIPMLIKNYDLESEMELVPLASNVFESMDGMWMPIDTLRNEFNSEGRITLAREPYVHQYYEYYDDGTVKLDSMMLVSGNIAELSYSTRTIRYFNTAGDLEQEEEWRYNHDSLKYLFERGRMYYYTTSDVTEGTADQNRNLIAFPNPASTSVSLSTGRKTEMMEVSVVDNTGRTVLTTTIGANEQLDLTTLTSGTYTLTAKAANTNDAPLSTRIVKIQ